MLPLAIGIWLSLKPLNSKSLGSAPPKSPYPITTLKPFFFEASAIGKRCEQKKLRSFMRIKSLIICSYNLLRVFNF